MPYLLILLYLLIGYLLTLKGPVVRWIDRRMRKLEIAETKEYFVKEKMYSTFEKLEKIHRAKFIAAAIVFYPLILIYQLVQFFRDKENAELSEKLAEEVGQGKGAHKENEHLHRLSELNGPGIFTCRVCSHTEQLVSPHQAQFNPLFQVVEYQCQGACAAFFQIPTGEVEKSGDISYFLCEECNEKLENEQPIRCPACHSHLLDFEVMEFSDKAYKGFLTTTRSSHYLHPVEIDGEGRQFRKVQKMSLPF